MHGEQLLEDALYLPAWDEPCSWNISWKFLVEELILYVEKLPCMGWLDCMWKHCRIQAEALELVEVWRLRRCTGISLFPSSWRINSVCRIIFHVWMTECMQETAGFDLYVFLVEEMQIQPLFWHHVEYWIHLNETNSDVHMYTSIIYFIHWRTCST